MTPTSGALTGAAVFRWGAPVPGREGLALKVFERFLEWCDELAKTGRIHAHEEWMSVTGGPGGLLIMSGPLEDLLQLQAGDEALRLRQEATLVVTHFEVQVYAGGTDASLQQVLRDWTEAADDLDLL
ncbi:MAG: hypothetical protein QOJ92_1841 [Frankiales bacterium]|nr:hypothetical protein [Frankiales bacterium]